MGATGDVQGGTAGGCAQVLVVANPANTNALILKENAPSIPAENITCLTRLDHNRALGQVHGTCVLLCERGVPEHRVVCG